MQMALEEAVQIGGNEVSKNQKVNNSLRERRRRRKNAKNGLNPVTPHGSAAADKVDAKEGIKQATPYKCDDCILVFSDFSCAIQHFKGKKHQLAIQAIASAKKPFNAKKATKTNQNNPQNATSSPSKVKPNKIVSITTEQAPNNTSDKGVRCDDCNLQFNSAIVAIPHFKGKRHALVIAKKLQGLQTQAIRKRQGNERPNAMPNQRGKRWQSGGGQSSARPNAMPNQREKRWQSGGGQGREPSRIERWGGGNDQAKDDYERSDNVVDKQQDRDEQLLNDMKKYYGNPFYNNSSTRSNPYDTTPKSRNSMQLNAYSENNTYGSPRPQRNYETQPQDYPSSSTEQLHGMYYDPKQPSNDSSVSTAAPHDNYPGNIDNGNYNNYSWNNYSRNNYSNSNTLE